MKVLLVPPSIAADPDAPAPYSTSYIINDTVAIDAGCVGFHGTPGEQARIRHVFLSHSHLDHVASLPVLVENIYDPSRPPVKVWASEAVLDSLRRDFFNDRVWPDFFALGQRHAPFFETHVLHARQPVEADGLRVTPVPVNHVVPTFGFIVEDGDSAIVIVSDTAATELIWEEVNRRANVKAVFLEASFPSSMTRLAQTALHLTPRAFAEEIGKLQEKTRIVAVHIKAKFYPQIVEELKALGLPEVTIARYGEAYAL